MAEKRMFSKKITDSDAFIEMNSSAQALYFHLNQGSDDDGFNNQVQIAMIKSHSSSDDLKILMAKKFIIRFDNGVIVIKHWRINNTLRKDRHIDTNFQDELKMLGIKENGAYTLNNNIKRLPSGCQVVAVDKNSIVENSIVENSIDKISLVKDKKISPESQEINQIIDLYKKYFNKTYRLSFEEKTTICHINNQEEYTLDDWETIFKNASKGWMIKNEKVKPALSNILANYSKFLNDDYNLGAENTETTGVYNPYA